MKLNKKAAMTLQHYRFWTLTPLIKAVLIGLAVFGFLVDKGYSSPRVITLATLEDFAPYAYLDSDEQWRGIDYDIAHEVFNRAGIKFQLLALPIKRLNLMLEKREIQGVLSSAPFAESERLLSLLWFSDVIYPSDLSASN